MEIPTWLLELAVSAVGVVGFFMFRYVLQLIKEVDKMRSLDIDKLKSETDSAIKSLSSDISELKINMEARVENSETKLLDAIEKITSRMVPMVHCDGRQEIWKERFDNIVKVLESRAESDIRIHNEITKSLAEITKEVSSLRESILCIVNNNGTNNNNSSIDKYPDKYNRS